MPINPERIRADIEAIARCTETPGKGASRPTFSQPWREARDYVGSQSVMAGCAVRIDACGNLHARPAAVAEHERVWLCGSHVDSVPHGGDFDGVVGVVVALEVLRAAAEDGRAAKCELIIFAEEEGTTFGLGMLGSRSWTGELSVEELGSVLNRDNQSYLEAGRAFGVDPKRIPAERIDASRYRGLIEAHIEQGPGMWKRGEPVAVVTAIAGRKQYRVRLTGVSNHAGSTAMTDRHDALAGAATLILQLEGLARGLLESAVITVGQIVNKPNAINVIPGEVEFTIDFRSPDSDTLADGDSRIGELIAQVCAKRGLRHSIELTEDVPVVAMNDDLCGKLSKAAARVVGKPSARTSSGALHDAAILARHVPTAMLFVPSRDGVSHNPDEFSRVEDVALAARVVYEVVSE